MGIFDNFRKRDGEQKSEIPSVQKGADLSTGSSWAEIFGGTSGANFSTFNSQKEQLQAYVDWVYAATRYIAETCATIDLRVFQNNTQLSKGTLAQRMIYHPLALQKQMVRMGKRQIIEKDAQGRLVTRQAAPLEELEAHPILDLLDCPNPFMTRQEFFEMTFLHLELAGESFWAINRKSKNGPPSELWPLMPNLVSVVADPEKFILGYLYTVDGQQLPFAPEDIIHHKYSNPSDFRRGMSAVQAAARIIDTDSHMADNNRRIFYNGGQVDAVLQTDNKLTDEVWKRLNAQWEDKYTGSSNAHKTAILENGLKYQPMALSNRDLDFLQGMNFNRDMILAIFGVPKSLLGMDESMSRANAEAAEYAFSKNKVRAKMLRLTTRITEDLASQFSDNIIVSFTDPVPDDKEFLLKEKQASVGSTSQTPWRTINEIRAEDGDDPMEGGDELWIQGTLVPVAYAAQEPVPEEKPAVAEEDPKSPDNEEDVSDEEGSEDNDSGGGASESTDTGNNSSSSSGSGNNSSAGSAGSTSSDTSTGDKTFKQVSANDYPNLYDDLGIDPSDLGCIMMDCEGLPVMDVMKGSEDDLDPEDTVPDQTHVTLLYGLLENGNKWKDKVDTLLKGWNMDSIQLDHVDSFDLGEKYAVVAHVTKTSELIDGHERLTLLPHIQTYSEYKPHVTLAYVKHDKKTVDKWVDELSKEYNGKVIKTVGINYGRPEEKDMEEGDDEDGGALVPHAKPKEDDKGLKVDEPLYQISDNGYHGASGLEVLQSVAQGEVFESKTNGVIHSTDSKVEEDTKSTALSQEQRLKLHKTYEDIRNQVSDKYEDAFMKEAHLIFEEQKKEVLRNVESTFKNYRPSKKGITKSQKDKVNNLFDKAKSLTKWVKRLLPLYKGTVVTTGNAAFNYVAGASTQGTSGQFSGADPDIQKFYDERTTEVSKGIDETTERLLKTTLIEGISKGESVASLMDRVEGVYNAAAGYRALRIARTESIAASTFGTINAWQQSGVVIGKKWFTGAANPCPFCASLNGKIVALNTNYFNKGDTFTIGEGENAQSMSLNYDDVGGPPIHPNCRCTLLPILVGESME